MRSTKGLMACLVLVALGGTARGGQLEVAPITLDLPPLAASTLLTVTNRGAERTGIQIRGFAWSQTTGSDNLAPTRALLISPPAAQLDPGETQTVRILLRTAPHGAEASYRVLVDELPAPGMAGVIRLALRVSLPLFVAPTEPTAANLQWRLVSSSAGTELQAVNRGTKRERVSEMAVQVAGYGTVKPQPLTNAWILAGAERHWPIPSLQTGEVRASHANLTARFEGGNASAAAVPVLRAP